MNRILFLGFFLFLLGCEPDDICSQSIQTTPRLVIEFFNIENLLDNKIVPGLFAVGLDVDGNEIPIYGETVSSREIIKLPLDGNRNTTEFLLYKNYNIVDGDIEGEPSLITINYSTQYEYVSRACGYKNVYTIQGFDIQDDADNWMILFVVQSNEVNNENTTHIEIFH